MMSKNVSTRLWIAASFAVALVGCGGGSSTDDFATALKRNSNMPDEVADCFADLAEQELSENARNFLVAGMNQDSDTTDALRGEMSFADLTQAGMFMASAGGRCGAPE